MTEAFSKQFLNKIKEYKQIALFVHIQPDFDCYAGAFGIKKWLKDNFPDIKTYLIIPPETFKESEKFLFHSEETLPSESQLSSCLGIIVDTSVPDRVLTRLHVHCREIMVIDHHVKTQTFAEMEFIDPTYPAVAQILAEIFFYLEPLGYIFSEELAQYFYAGIITDTNNFLSCKMTPSTYIVISKLASKGLNRSAIHDFIFEQPMNHKLFNNKILNNATLTENGLAYSIISKKEIEKHKAHDFPNPVNMLSNISNIEIWTTLVYDTYTKKWKCSIRSKDISIDHIAQLYGGGGHKTMSAAVFNKKFQYYKLLTTLNQHLIKYGYRNVSLKDSNFYFWLKIYKLFNLYRKT